MVDKKRLFVFFVLGMFLFSLVGVLGDDTVVGGAVSKAADVFNREAGATYETLKPTLEVVFGDASNSNVFLAKLLFAFIVFSIIWMAVKNTSLFGDSDTVRWLITLAVTLLAIRWVMNVALMQAILLPYSALGITIIAGIPFVLFFFVVKDFRSDMYRKVAWIAFAVVFVAIWYVRSYGAPGAITPEQLEFAKYSFVYLIVALLSLGMWVFDKYIQNWLSAAHTAGKHRRKQKRDLHDFLDEYDKVIERQRRGIIDKKDANDMIDDIRSRASGISKSHFPKIK